MHGGRPADEEDDARVETLLAHRAAARASKLYALADSLRDELLMVDTPAAGRLFAAACP